MGVGKDPRLPGGRERTLNYLGSREGTPDCLRSREGTPNYLRVGRGPRITGGGQGRAPGLQGQGGTPEDCVGGRRRRPREWGGGGGNRGSPLRTGAMCAPAAPHV